MSNRDKWRLCGGTFFILISDARKAMPSHDEMYMGKKSGITEPETLFALARIVTPDLPEPMSSEEKSWRDGTFDFKSCKGWGWKQYRFVDASVRASYDNDVAVKAMLQIRDILLKSEKLKTSAKNNSEKDFEFSYFDNINDDYDSASETADTIHESYEYIPIRASYILQLHRDLYKYSEKSIGGRFKNTQNIIAETKADGTQFVRFTPLPPYETASAIDAICESFNQVIDSCVIDPLVLIPVFINDFLCIHPFNDGNGRMSRLLTTLLLYRSEYVVGRYISIESKIEKTKGNYYDALEKSSIGWHEEANDPSPFIKYFLSIILAAYRDFESRISLVDEKQPAIEQVRAAVKERIGKFTKSEIMELVPAIGKASVENSLKKLTQEGFIERHGKGKSTFYTRKDNL